MENSPPHSKIAPPQTFEVAKLGEKSPWILAKTFFFLEITWFWVEKTFEFRISAEKSLWILAKTFFFFFFWRSPDFGRKNLWISDFGRKITLNFGEDLFFFFFFFWRSPDFGRKNLWISDFGRKITLNFGEDLFFFFIFFFFWRSPDFGRKKPLNFGFRPKNHSEFWRRPFFFLEITWFWAEKTFEFRISAEKSLWILAKTFFFFLEITWFWAEKTFEFPIFPRHFVSNFGQTIWNWFKANENSSQRRLHTSHSFKIAPPFPNPGYAPGLFVVFGFIQDGGNAA